jgi:putative aldouronate transport system permease protein
MVNNNIATSSAAGAFQAIVGFLLVITVNGIVKKVDRDNALF